MEVLRGVVVVKKNQIEIHFMIIHDYIKICLNFVRMQKQVDLGKVILILKS